jgi:hypothetical protein
MHAKNLAVLVMTAASLTIFAGHLIAQNLPRPLNELDARLLSEYGAVQMAQGGVVLPPGALFDSGEDVADWQSRVPVARGEPALQTAAAAALGAAREEAMAHGLTISPRGPDAAARSYQDTVELWRSRVAPGLEHWVNKGRLTRQEADGIRSLPVRDQVAKILDLESEGTYFSLGFSKSILTSVAPPGASQHLALLAFDVKEHADSRVRVILERHGWFQTVVSDCPHFTYLGVAKSRLSSLALTRIVAGDREYWVPRRSELAVKFAKR